MGFPYTYGFISQSQHSITVLATSPITVLQQTEESISGGVLVVEIKGKVYVAANLSPDLATRTSEIDPLLDILQLYKDIAIAHGTEALIVLNAHALSPADKAHHAAVEQYADTMEVCITRFLP